MSRKSALRKKARATSLVYMLECEGFFKIGRSDRFSYRLGQMRTGCPFPIRVVKCFTVPWEAAAAIESGAHRRLENFHHRGEWFRCSRDEATTAVEAAISEVAADPNFPLRFGRAGTPENDASVDKLVARIKAGTTRPTPALSKKARLPLPPMPAKIPHLRHKPSGFYWEPSKRLRAMGFEARPLGADEAVATERAHSLNESIKRHLQPGGTA